MSWKADKYFKPSYRNKEGGRIISLAKTYPNKAKKCWFCHKRRISKYHHNLCERCWREKQENGHNVEHI